MGKGCKHLLHDAELVEQVRLGRLGADGREADELGRTRRLEGGPDRGYDPPHLGKARRRVEARWQQEEDSLRTLESGRERRGIVDRCERDVAAARRPGRRLAGIAQHGADGAFRAQQVARDGAPDLAGNSGDGIHDDSP